MLEDSVEGSTDLLLDICHYMYYYNYYYCRLGLVFVTRFVK